MIIARGVLHQGFEHFLPVLFLLVIAVAAVLRQLHTRTLGKQLHRVDVSDRLHLHNERNDVAARSAAEAMVILSVGIDAHRGSFFVVERTATKIFVPLFDQRNILRDYAHDVAFIFQFFQESVGKTCHPYVLCIGRRLRAPAHFVCVLYYYS